jgi:hypothetical protein
MPPNGERKFFSSAYIILGDFHSLDLIYKGEQNNGNTKNLRNRICVGYIERIPVVNIEFCSSCSLHFLVLLEVH